MAEPSGGLPMSSSDIAIHARNVSKSYRIVHEERLKRGRGLVAAEETQRRFQRGEFDQKNERADERTTSPGNTGKNRARHPTRYTITP